VDIEKHGARGVADIGGVHRTMGELPDQPAVHRAKGQFAVECLRACAGHMVQNPFELGTGEIGINQQAGAGLNCWRQTAFAQIEAGGFRPAVLPDDGVMNRDASAAVPDHRGFALVGDADGANVAGREPGFDERLACGGQLTAPNGHRVMFDPTRLRVDLWQLLLGKCNDTAIRIKNNAARTGSALVKGE
jgi:hypothetical protein